MEIAAFVTLVIPFIIIFYLAVLLFLRPPRRVLLASLLGGLVMTLINAFVDLVASFAHWWHYTLNGVVPAQLCLSSPCTNLEIDTMPLHLPLPFYITTLLIYGSVVYLLIWRFWGGRANWLAILFLAGVPIFGIVRDIYGQVTHTSYASWQSFWAWPADILMWLVMFYAGYIVFRQLAPDRVIVIQNNHEGPSDPMQLDDVELREPSNLHEP